MIQPERVKALNDKSNRDGRFVLYWLQDNYESRGNGGKKRRKK